MDRETNAWTTAALLPVRAEPEPAAARPRRRGAVRGARTALWLAAVLPFIYSTSKSASALAAGGGVGTLEIVRGAGPAALWALSLLLAPTVRRGMGVVEIALALFGTVTLISVLIPGNPSPQGSLLKSVSMIFVLLSLARLARMYPTPLGGVTGLVGLVHIMLFAAVVQVVLFRSTVYAAGVGTLDNLPRLNILVPQVSANPLALVAVAGILSCVLGVAPRWLPFNPVIRNGLIVVYIYLIILTRTRSALGVGLLVILLALVARARRRPLSTLAIMVGLVLAALLVLPSLLPDLHSFIQRGQTTQGIDTLSGRTVVWDYALNAWRDNKVFGLGYYTGHRLGIPGLSQTQSNIDNTWLETMVDVGLLGLVSLALFASAGFVRLVRTRELVGDWKLWALGVAVYGLAISFVNPTIQAPGPAQVIVGFLLMIVVPPHVVAPVTASSETPGPETSDPRPIPAGAGGT